ncbi:MAG TPA: hypothetical protein VMT62_07890 [Syntrophorhabdaceae bacterium]|nr:hypothetical protein [Syntrophorhabdaceae bacterium]
MRTIRVKDCRAGVALLTILVLVTISAGLIAAIMFFSNTGLEISGLQRQYESAREASLGAAGVLVQDVMPQVLANKYTFHNLLGSYSTITSASVVAGTGVTDDCFNRKLLYDPSNTNNAQNWTGCPASAQTTDPTQSTDLVFTLKGTGGPSYTVDLKIAGTTPGNSNTSGTSLIGQGVTEAGSGVITVQHYPYLYTILAHGQRVNNPVERVDLEILYAY